MDVVQVEVISIVTAVTEDLFDLSDEVLNLAPFQLKNGNMVNALTNKLNSVLAMVEDGDYQAAYDKLTNDVLKKTDGCTSATESTR